MAFGKIPRFSPSFSPSEAWICAKHLLGMGAGDDAVDEFEATFAQFIGAKHGVMVPSARYGLFLLLDALGVGEGDEVVVPGLTYFAIPAMVELLGAKPVFADIGLHSHVLDPAAFEEAITERTKAVIPTHLFGTPCDMDAINSIAAKHNIEVIEDCAQSTGARYKGRRVGAIGGHAYYTFGLTKNITTLSGAMVTTDDPQVAARIRATIQNSGQSPAAKSIKEAVTGVAMFVATHPWMYWWTVHPAIVLGNAMGKDPIHERFGETERTYDTVPTSYQEQARARAVQAAVGLKQLERIETLNGSRMRNGQALDKGLNNVQGLGVPSYPDGSEPIYMSFVVHHSNRDALMTALRARGVDTTTGYMSDLSDHPLFQDHRRPCPNAARAMAQLLHIPVHPNLKESDVAHLISAVRAATVETNP
jgi:dTDP-4-amino-4,6-dideoxygalactose transaminase